MSEKTRGGVLLFPHFSAERCGHLIAAAVHAALDSKSPRVLLLGVLHALDAELDDARKRVAAGGDPSEHESWGIQGPDLGGLKHWEREFSLSHFQWLWREECARRGVTCPELIVRYPFLAGGRPEQLPGIAELENLVADGVFLVATADPFHHGHAYGDEHPIEAEAGGLDAARESIEEGFRVMSKGQPQAWQEHCLGAKSDARDVGQVILHLCGPMNGCIHELTWEDMSEAYAVSSPNWVAGGLIELTAMEK
ncbi:hypothetical protein H8E52_00750 [bacterium]|nr:hypothetical protein [bacterium]